MNRRCRGWSVGGAALLAGLTAAFVLTSTGVEAASDHRVCGPASARTLAVNRQTRVYVLFDRRHGHHVPYACGRGHEKRRTLTHLYESECGGSSSGCGGLGKYLLAGRFVAYEDYDCCGSDQITEFTINVLDTRSMHLRSRARFRGALSRLVLRANGAAAWSYSTFREPDQTARGHVRRFPACGGTSLLASGPAVEAETLRLAGDGITWREASVDRTARLC